MMPRFSVYNGILWFGARLCVFTAGDLRSRIIGKVYSSAYIIHLGANKMYQDLRMYYWWRGMKRDIIDFVVRCSTYQQVKIEHQ